MNKLFNPTADYETAQVLPKERAVRSILNTSVDDGKINLKSCDDIQVLEEAIKREDAKEKDARKGILQPLRSKLAKLKKTKGELAMVVDNNPEVQHPDIWSRAKQYATAAKRFARASVACQVMLGFELTELKKELGYTQGRKSSKKKNPTESVFSTWSEHCKAELGITDDTARKYINMAEGAKRRLKSCYNNLPLLDKPVTEFSDEQLELLDKAVRKITDGQTQSQFLIDYGIAKAPQGSAAKGGNLGGKDDDEDEKTEPTMEQIAFVLFAEPVQQITQLRTNSNYQAALHSLPVAGATPEDISLTTLERDLETMLAEVREAKQSRSQSIDTELAQLPA
ncbi:hypothetical protein [Rubritalea sp.]|uniref:hypothetical protein n=1 Tax=Rubritalea sp. TaxID=2109375 RepID=UPI003EF83CDC